MKHTNLPFRLLLALSLTFVFSGSAFGEPTKWSVRITENNLPSSATVSNFSYVPYNVAMDREASRSALALESLDQRAAMAAGVPKGGYIELKFTGLTLAVVDPSSWLYVITDDTGKELLRKHGERSLGSSEGIGQGWGNFDILFIPELVPDTFRV
jgi:hypothetical protein